MPRSIPLWKFVGFRSGAIRQTLSPYSPKKACLRSAVVFLLSDGKKESICGIADRSHQELPSSPRRVSLFSLGGGEGKRVGPLARGSFAAMRRKRGW